MNEPTLAVSVGNCPVLERTAEGIGVGRCWYYLKDRVCPRHGDVTKEVGAYSTTGKLQEDPRG